MFVACAVPIRRIDKLFIDAVDSLFHLNHPDIHYLLFFDQVKLEDPDSILNWKTFEEFLFDSVRWKNGQVVIASARRRRGLINSWNNSSELARNLFSGAELFFWASDHDLWHPDFLELPLRIFRADSKSCTRPLTLIVPQPGNLHNGSTSKKLEILPRRLTKFYGIYPPGYSLYGVFKLSDFPRLPNVLLPDRLFISIFSAKYSILCENCDEIKYLRRIIDSERFSINRQKRNLWAPETKRLYFGQGPWWACHLFIISKEFVINRIYKRDYTFSFEWYFVMVAGQIYKIKIIKKVIIRPVIKIVLSIKKAFSRFGNF